MRQHVNAADHEDQRTPTSPGAADSLTNATTGRTTQTPEGIKDSAANVECYGPVDDENQVLDGYSAVSATFDADVDGTRC